MIYQYNPFKENRAEQMTDLWKYYVPVPGIDNAAKPLIVEGGRGSGKTMFFLCNSWREKLSQYKKEKQDIALLLDEESFIGIYYRVDTSFVATMKEKNRDNWDAVFETYFTLCLLKELVLFFNAIYDNDLMCEKGLLSIIKNVSSKIDKNCSASSCDEMLSYIEEYLDSIEDLINSSNAMNFELPYRYLKVSRTISSIVDEFNKIIKKNILFKIFVDEYETLLDNQQRIVNTLIKHSTYPVIYNIGLRPEGMRIKQTISDTEPLEAPHDFEFLELGIGNKNYNNILKEICKKRILSAKELGRLPEYAVENIEFYLGKYSIDDEITSIISSNVKPKFFEKLKQTIKLLGKNEGLELDQLNEYIEKLCINASPLNAKLHYLLLNTKTQYSPTLKELYKEYITNSDRYKEWLHNRKFGILFLLARDYKKSKMYYGFDVYSALSSGIVRYFLELCENAFKFAYLNSFDWQDPIAPEIQTEAAKHVSSYKIRDIVGYKPYGRELRVFVQYLGQIFQELHLSENITLGEPEPNHFYTDDLSINDNVDKILSSSIMWNVIQVDEANKRKNANLSSETVDYHLNKIYIPYFGISYRDKRKIKISCENLEKLLSGNAKIAKEVVKEYIKRSKDDNNDENIQLSIFDLYEV